MKIYMLLFLAWLCGGFGIDAADVPKPPEAKTGDYTTTFTERNPLSASPELLRRLANLLEGPRIQAW